MTHARGRGPRERMVYSAAQLIRARGMAGVGVREVIEHAEAPRGSFQHYFPHGKDQLVAEAVEWAGTFAAARTRRYLQHARRPSPGGLFAYLVQQWIDDFTAHGYERGCPLVATATDVAGTDSAVSGPLNDAATGWELAIVETLVDIGVPRRRARPGALLMLSALEGAIVLARVRGDVAPLRTVVTELRPVLDAYRD